MQIFKNTNFDFLRYKWPFIGASLVLSVAGIGSIIAHGGLRYGIDFKEGTQMTVKWNGAPPEDKIRAALSKRINGEVTVQPFTDLANQNSIVIGTERMGEQQMAAASKAMQDTLEATFGDPQSGKLDFNNAGATEIADRLTVPLQQAGVQLSDQQLLALAADLRTFRDTPPRSGLISDFDQLKAMPGVNSAIISVLKQQCYLAPFSVRQVEMVGPKVGAELRTKAVLATLYAHGSKGCLDIAGDVVASGLPTLWAGAMFVPGKARMEPVDLSAKKSLSFWARGEGRPYAVMIFAQ